MKPCTLVTPCLLRPQELILNTVEQSQRCVGLPIPRSFLTNLSQGSQTYEEAGRLLSSGNRVWAGRDSEASLQNIYAHVAVCSMDPPRAKINETH